MQLSLNIMKKAVFKAKAKDFTIKRFCARARPDNSQIVMALIGEPLGREN